MFDLIVGATPRPLRDRRSSPALLSLGVHGVVLAAAVMSLLSATGNLPRAPHGPGIDAFVVNERPSPSVPPPAVVSTAESRSVPPPSRAQAAPPSVNAAPVSAAAAPTAAPAELPSSNPDEVVAAAGAAGREGPTAGSLQGFGESGISGGVLEAPSAPPPPPPAPAPAARTPVRIGGRISAPKLLVQVQPIYPAVAAASQVAGLVILEATVDADGIVRSVRVLQAQALLEDAAIDAVKQWRYSPVLLDGVPTPFIVVVTINFRAKP